MPALRWPDERAGPALERVVARTFPDPVSDCAPEDRDNLMERMESLYGAGTDRSWLTDGPMISYHQMVRTVVQELGPELVGVDLTITVDASPDCRHQSFPGPVLSHVLPGDPIMLGVSEQGVAGPFTALRIAHRYLSAGSATRALILIMEQSTLPPDDAAVRPVRDVAVALLLSAEGVIGLDVPTVAVTRTGPVAAPGTGPGADPHSAAGRRADPSSSGQADPLSTIDGQVDLLVAGAGLAGQAGLPAGVPVRWAEPGHPCAGVWLALADLLASQPDGGRVLVADRDPVLPYRCAVTLTLPAARRPATAPRRPAGVAGPPTHRHPVTRTRHAKELVP